MEGGVKKNFLKKCNFHYVYFVSTFSVSTGGDGRYVQGKHFSRQIIRTNPGLSKNTRVQALRLVYLRWFNHLKNQQYTIKLRLNSGLS